MKLAYPLFATQLVNGQQVAEGFLRVGCRIKRVTFLDRVCAATGQLYQVAQFVADDRGVSIEEADADAFRAALAS